LLLDVPNQVSALAKYGVQEAPLQGRLGRVVAVLDGVLIAQFPSFFCGPLPARAGFDVPDRGLPPIVGVDVLDRDLLL
jgi:hypothetical protein